MQRASGCVLITVKRLVVVINARTAQFIEFVQMSEMIAEHWEKNLGVKTSVNALERSLAGQLQAADQNQISVSWGDGSEHLFTFPGHVFPAFTSNEFGSSLGAMVPVRWRKGRRAATRTQGGNGELQEGIRRAPKAERIELGKEIWRTVLDQAWSVGLVGQSPASSRHQSNQDRSWQCS